MASMTEIMFPTPDARNRFQKWADDYGRAFGFLVTPRHNWVELHKDGERFECFTVQGVQDTCAKAGD